MHKPAHASSTCCTLAVVISLYAGAPAYAQTAPGAPAKGVAAGSVTPSTDVGDLFTGTVRAFQHLPSRDTLSWFTFGVAAALLTHTVDGRVTSGLSGSQSWGNRL